MNKQNNKTEVYSTTGFKDTLASPAFYPVIVVSLVLGVTSIFGFVQNPLKLKNVVNVIQQKVSFSPINEDNYNSRYSLSQPSPKIEQSQTNKLPANEVQAFRNDLTHAVSQKSDLDLILETLSTIEAGVTYKAPANERVRYDYDQTTNKFWTKLDSSILDSNIDQSIIEQNNIEKNIIEQKDASSIGIPLESDYLKGHQPDLNMLDDSIYAINNKLSKI